MLLNLKKSFYTLLLVLLICGYSLFLLLGAQTHYMQDDYCYGEKVRNEGFWQAQYDSYFGSEIPYPGNRYSLTLFSGIFEALFPNHYPAFNYFSILAFILGLFLLLKYLLQTFKINASWQIVLISVLALSFIMFYIAPNRFQTLYFRAASISYFYALVFQIWVGYLFLLYIQKKQSYILWMMFVIAVLASGFSEVGAVIQFSLWIFFFLLFWLKGKKKTPMLASGVIIFATLLGIALLLLCPNNQERQVNFGTPNNLVNVLKDGPLFALDFISYTISSFRLPVLILFLTGLFLSQEIDNPFKNTRHALLFGGISLLVAYGLIVVNILPSLYAYSAIPDNRGLTEALFILLTAILLSSFVLGWLGKRHTNLSGNLSSILSIVVLIGITLYVGRAGLQLLQDFEVYRNRDTLWDARHAQILQIIESGESDITVQALDSFYRTAELQVDAQHWVNLCAAKWYDVESIQALE